MAMRKIAVAMLLVVASSSAARATIRTVVYYRLGEDDPGAAAGQAGNQTTVDASGGRLDLDRSGTPHYSADTDPAGGTLSMSFKPATFDAYWRVPVTGATD